MSERKQEIWKKVKRADEFAGNVADVGSIGLAFSANPAAVATSAALTAGTAGDIASRAARKGLEKGLKLEGEPTDLFPQKSSLTRTVLDASAATNPFIAPVYFTGKAVVPVAKKWRDQKRANENNIAPIDEPLVDELEFPTGELDSPTDEFPTGESAKVFGGNHVAENNNDIASRIIFAIAMILVIFLMYAVWRILYGIYENQKIASNINQLNSNRSNASI